ANEACSIIDPNWEVTNDSNSTIFCPLILQDTVIELVVMYSTHYILLPKLDSTFTTNSTEI
ncbi:3680_t:CDS:1, partial [Scutellospora calospora]